MTEKIQKIEIQVDPLKLIASTVLVALWWNLSSIFIEILERMVERIPI